MRRPGPLAAALPVAALAALPAGALIARIAGVKMLHVPYKDAGIGIE